MQRIPIPTPWAMDGAWLISSAEVLEMSAVQLRSELGEIVSEDSHFMAGAAITMNGGHIAA